MEQVLNCGHYTLFNDVLYIIMVIQSRSLQALQFYAVNSLRMRAAVQQSSLRNFHAGQPLHDHPDLVSSSHHRSDPTVYSAQKLLPTPDLQRGLFFDPTESTWTCKG